MSHKSAKRIRREMRQASSLRGNDMDPQYMQQQTQQLPNFKNIKLRPNCTRARYQQLKREEKQNDPTDI